MRTRESQKAVSIDSGLPVTISYEVSLFPKGGTKKSLARPYVILWPWESDRVREFKTSWFAQCSGRLTRCGRQKVHLQWKSHFSNSCFATVRASALCQGKASTLPENIHTIRGMY